MNKIVREHYPVRQLPEDLRRGLDLNGNVRVVLEEQTGPSAEQLRRSLENARKLHPIGDDPVARIRRLRDEWDD